jgi:hypothetical protein
MVLAALLLAVALADPSSTGPNRRSSRNLRTGRRLQKGGNKGGKKNGDSGGPMTKVAEKEEKGNNGKAGDNGNAKGDPEEENGGNGKAKGNPFVVVVPDSTTNEATPEEEEKREQLKKEAKEEAALALEEEAEEELPADESDLDAESNPSAEEDYISVGNDDGKGKGKSEGVKPGQAKKEPQNLNEPADAQPEKSSDKKARAVKKPLKNTIVPDFKAKAENDGKKVMQESDIGVEPPPDFEDDGDDEDEEDQMKAKKRAEMLKDTQVPDYKISNGEEEEQERLKENPGKEKNIKARRG